MKKNFLAVFALVVAAAFSAFTIEKSTANADASLLISPHYYSYIGSDQQTFDTDNFSDLGTGLPLDCSQAVQLCWIKVSDVTRPGGGAPDNLLTQEDFDIAFNAIDGDAGGTANGSLNDETENNTTFSKKP